MCVCVCVCVCARMHFSPVGMQLGVGGSYRRQYHTRDAIAHRSANMSRQSIDIRLPCHLMLRRFSWSSSHDLKMHLQATLAHAVHVTAQHH